MRSPKKEEPNWMLGVYSGIALLVWSVIQCFLGDRKFADSFLLGIAALLMFGLSEGYR